MMTNLMFGKVHDKSTSEAKKQKAEEVKKKIVVYSFRFLLYMAYNISRKGCFKCGNRASTLLH
jgi:hypothetical protein